MYKLLDLVGELRWRLKGRVLVGALVGSTLFAGVLVGWTLRGTGNDPVYKEVRGAVVLLRGDFAAGSEKLGGTYIRYFRGERNGGLVGEVVRKVDRGTCWGFEVFFPNDWLRLGTGEISVGDVRKYPAEMCREAQRS